MSTPTPKPHGKRNTVLLALLLVITLVVNVVCIQMFAAINTFMTANLNSKLPGARSTNIDAENMTPAEAEEAARAMAQTLIGEGLVLLENNGALPLASGTKVNLFGYATVDPIYGGTGSGSSDTSSNVDLIQGLTNAGFEVNQELVDFYKKSGVKRPDQSGYTGSNFTPAEVPASQYTDALLQNAKAFSDVAVLMFSRIGGEGGDLPIDMYASKFSKTDDGRHYLELTQDEQDLLDLVLAQNYGTVVVLINSSNAMELGFLEQNGIDAAMWVGSTGSTGMNAVGEALAGVINPSGRLVDTYAYDLTTSPAYWNAGDFTYGNVKYNYVEYAEGIYVGYRYYETRFIDNATGACDEAAYAKTVQYPFGYGKSYTTFTQEMGEVQEKDGQLTVDVTVTNTGSVAGKEVVQLYYTAPYTVGGIEKSHVVLAAFDKTELLEPGASEKVTLSFAKQDMASYDEKGAGCYVLEAGDYAIKLMSNAHEVIDSKTINVAQTVTYDASNPREGDVTAATNQFQDIANGQITTYLSRADWEGTFPKERINGKDASAEAVAALSSAPVYEDDPNATAITFADHGLTLEDMAGLDYDDPQWALLLEQLSVEDMTNMISNGGWSTPEVLSVGKPATNDLDGPAGINSLVSDLHGVSYPSETIIGSTWNEDLVEEFGRVFGAEAAANHVVGLYAPGANIHRSPFSGRNFEYYAEDGLLSGKMAAGFVRGTASQGIYCYVKHFALNDQESNRLSICVWSNEQAMRELYFKPFELAVKEGGTTAIMSSYSHFGTTWAGACKPLLTNVLRGEWGFNGMVVTDSAMGNTSWMDVNLGIRAGNDMMLCLMGVSLDASTNTAQQAMRTACHNILYTQANSAAVSVAADNTPYWMLLLVLLGTIVAAVLVFALLKKTGKPVFSKLPVRIAIVVVLAAVFMLVFWMNFFRKQSVAAGSSTDATGTAASSAASSSEATAEPTNEPQTDTVEGLYMELYGKDIDSGYAWLGCHVYLMEDGTFTLTWDYDDANKGIEGDKGTWVDNEDGSLALTGAKEYTATATADGFEMEVVNEQTGLTCALIGAVAGGAPAAPAIEGLYMELYGKDIDSGYAWLGCHVYLMEDGTFTLTWDYDDANKGIEGDKGTWTTNEDGSLTLTGAKEYTATDTADGFEIQVLNEQTGLNCVLTGAPVGAAGTASDTTELYGVDTDSGWLGCHVYLNDDNTFTLTWDYNADNSGIEGDKGTWAANEDGSLTLTGAKEYTAAKTADGYEMEVLNEQTGLTCKLTGKN